MKIPSTADIHRDPNLASLALALLMSHENRRRPKDHIVKAQRPIEDEVEAESLANPFLGPILRAAWQAGRGCILPDIVNIYHAARDCLLLEHQMKDEKAAKAAQARKENP